MPHYPAIFLAFQSINIQLAPKCWSKHALSETRIRAANAADAPLLADIIRGSFQDVAKRFGLTLENCPKHPSNYTSDWVERDLGRGVAYFVLVDGNIPVGCVALEKANDAVCYLERLAVLPGCRRKGLGRMLVDHVFSQARALGARTLSIGIIAADTQLKQWYQEIGFVEGETRKYEHLPFLVLFMTCTL
jgi:GNAT superfamily N-acetyltransferase